MADIKGNFYHESGDQIIDGAVLRNCEAESLVAGSAGILSEGPITLNENGPQIFVSATAPDGTVKKAAGSVCICTASGAIALYLNKGDATTPSWKAVTVAS